jgi:HEAT repeat protein
MRKPLLLFILMFLVTLTVADTSKAQREGFIPVDGANLRSKLDAAISRGKASAAGSRFWAAYSFDVRPGVAVDAEIHNENGSTTIVNGTSFSIGSKIETRNLGIFLLYDPSASAFERVEIYNLDRRREYSGYPVYWLGRAGNEESLSLLKGFIESSQPAKVAEHSVAAIALHDDQRVDAILEDLVRRSNIEKVRSAAVFWLGQAPGHHPLLAEIVRNEQESTNLRKEAAFSMGISKDPAAMSTLQNLYGSISNREVKKQIIFAASLNKDDDSTAANNRSNDEGVTFLIKVAESDADRELRKQALFWLGQKAGKRSLEALGKAVDSNDADTEVQKQAVFAISQRPKDEAVPLLIKIARTHQKPAVRKQAIFWLGQTGDERALEFFKEILSK